MKNIMLSTVITVLFFSQFLTLQEVRAELLYPVEIDYQPIKVRISRIKIQDDGEQLGALVGDEVDEFCGEVYVGEFEAVCGDGAVGAFVGYAVNGLPGFAAGCE